ncbi:hypothetical protein LA304_02715 [Celeribacter sp. ASW11-22]|nr:hypothetical protein [Celeribacter litoreus]
MAEYEADRMIELWPDRAEGYVLKARAQYYSGRGGEAFGLLKRVAYDETLDPDQARWAAHWLATLYEDDARPEEVLSVLDGIEDDGSLPDYHHTMAFWAAFRTDRLDRAGVARDALLEMNPQSPDATYFDAILLAKSKSFDAAQEKVKEAISYGYDPQWLDEFYGVLAGHGEYLRLIQFKLHLSHAKSED